MDDPTPEDFLPLAARERLERVRALARTVLRDDYKARDFLARPHSLLDQRRPIDLIMAGEGENKRDEQILERDTGAHRRGGRLRPPR